MSHIKIVNLDSAISSGCTFDHAEKLLTGKCDKCGTRYFLDDLYDGLCYNC